MLINKLIVLINKIKAYLKVAKTINNRDIRNYLYNVI